MSIVEKIELQPNKILIQPTTETSSFSTEVKKYERKAVAKALLVGGDDNTKIATGTEYIIYDDSHSIDFTLDGENLSIVDITDVVAFVRKEK